MHVGDKDIVEAMHGSRPGLEVCKGTVIGLPVGLHEVVDI